MKSNLVRHVVFSATGLQRRDCGPLVTIVVPVYNVAKYLPEFLDSLVGQTYKNLEILVVDDGSPDESAAIARRWARWDRRIRVLSKLNGGLGDARNAGLRAARGTYITFADSDDILPSNGIRAMVDTIEASKSDFVVGTMVRMRGSKTWLPNWTKRVHGENRIGITIEECPEILLDVFACNKIWNTEFFRREVSGFPVGVAYEDQEPSAKSYLNAAKFDIITDHVYYWRIRDDGSSITQQKAKLSDLSDRITVSLAVAKHMAASDREQIRRAWYRKIFGTDLIQYVEQVPRTGREYFDALCDGFASIIDVCEDDFWKDVATYPALATWYVLQRDYDSLLEVIAGNLERGRGYRLSRNGEALMAAPLYADKLASPPREDILEIREEHLELVSRVTGIRWIDEYRVEVSGHAFARSAFAADEDTAISVAATDSLSGETVTVPTRTIHDPTVNEISNTEVRDCSGSGFAAVIDTRELPIADAPAIGREQMWQLVVSVAFESIRLTDVLKNLADDAGAAYLGHSSLLGDDRGFVLTHDPQKGLRFRRTVPKAVIGDINLHDRSLTVSVKSLLPAGISRLVLRSTGGGTSVSAVPVSVDHGGYARFEVDIPHRGSKVDPTRRSRWNARVILEDGSSRMMHIGRGASEEADLVDRSSALTLEFDSRGYVHLEEWPTRLTITSMEIVSDSLVVGGRAVVEDQRRRPQLVLVGDKIRQKPESFDWDGESAEFVARFDVSTTDWYGQRVALPLGAYAIMGRQVDAHGRAVTKEFHAFIPQRKAWILPWQGLTSLSRVRITRTRQAFRPWIKIMPRLSEHERGVLNRRIHMGQVESEVAADGLKEAIVFESYHGKQISDSVRALFDWVSANRPDIACYWSVNSSAVSVPSGAQAVIHGTSDWFAAIGSSRYLVNNANFPSYFRMAEGQRYLQTWHGTPMKKIAEDMPPGNLSLGYRVAMRREARYWGALLAQNDFAAEVLPRAFWFNGMTLNLGYPRNDLLSGPSSQHARSVTRSRLGIPDDCRVLLYAPTFRDNATVGGKHAFSTELDLELLLSNLPADTHVMIRGHANTGGAARFADRDRVIDVSAYGEISELFTACDVLVTDYSSMMFDFCVSGKPILFYTPDLDEYEQSIRGFYLDFRDICPGPIHRGTRSLATDLTRAFADPQSFVDARYTKFVDRFAPRDDGGATERIVDALQSSGWFQSPALRRRVHSAEGTEK